MQSEVEGLFARIDRVVETLQTADQAAVAATNNTEKEAKDNAQVATEAARQTAAAASTSQPEIQSKGSGSKVVAAARDRRTWDKPLTMALHKPVYERSGEDAIAAARAAKVARTQDSKDIEQDAIALDDV